VPPIVTLTTDFGTRDSYVATMKGVLLSLCANAQVIDLSHEIPPQDVFQGALFIAEATRWFPKDTIHCVVVDPGVGTARLQMVAQIDGQFFVCPNNGLLTFIARRAHAVKAYAISNETFMRDSVSATFHGRDIFAPTAARLANGALAHDAGDALSAIATLDVPEAHTDDAGTVHGTVIHIDRFGNAITNVDRESVLNSDSGTVWFGSMALQGIRSTYGDVAPGQALALFGSSGLLEIAVHRGNASETFTLRHGSRVEVRQA